MELYTPAAILDLSVYGLAVSHADGTSGSPEFVFPSDSIPKESFLYVSNKDESTMESYFGTLLDFFYQYSSLDLKFGDDAVELYNGNVVSI